MRVTEATDGGSGVRVKRAAVLAAVIAAAIVALAVPGASAVIGHLENGRTVSYQRLRGAAKASSASRAFSGAFDAFFSNVDYDGGPIMPSSTDYAFYWDPAGAPAYPAEYETGIDEYFEALAHDSGGHENVDSISAQYNDAAGEFAGYDAPFGGAIVDTDPYPSNGCGSAAICLTDAQLQAELVSYTSAHGLPTNLTTEYFMLTPPGVESCFEAKGRVCSAGSSHPVYCAYHGNVAAPGGELIYAEDPYVTGNEGCDDGNHPTGKPSDGALEGGLVHEHNESITDPMPNSAWTDYGGAEFGDEIGDKCEGEYGSPLGKAKNGAAYNQVIDGRGYWYQEMWSNQTHTCLQRLTFSGEEPTATFTSSPGAGNEVSFDASGSTAPGGVARYEWEFNDPPESEAVETTGPTVTHDFSVGGRYVVALTVFSSNGTSIGTARTLKVGKPPAPTVKRVTPKKGPMSGHTLVTISGSSFGEATAVKFGSASALEYKIDSETTITAVSPPGAKGRVEVTVTTPSGTSGPSRKGRFKYTR